MFAPAPTNDCVSVSYMPRKSSNQRKLLVIILILIGSSMICVALDDEVRLGC